MAEECVFCKIIRGEIPSAKVYEDEEIYAFQDIKPLAPVHILFVPKKHLRSLADLPEEDFALLGRLHAAAAKTARQFGIAERGYRTVINTNPEGGQIIFHLHLHLIGGKELPNFA